MDYGVQTTILKIMQQLKTWWKEEVIYQIYPRSFKDSNGDGIGDLQGIISKLDYLKNLGVDIIWLSPIYKSPNDDNGYDISDYYDIHPEFGTMADFDELLAGLHSRGMKLIMDLVVNHTSDEHEWFQDAKRSKDSKYRDYYIWKDGKDGKEPNNWPSFFGGSAWKYNEATDDYYLHLFTEKQPDLNWENPAVRDSICDILKFWLDKGINGFRMDVIPLISKRLEFADAQYDMLNEIIEHVYSNGPKVHTYINEMYERVLKNYDIMTVGEGPGINTEVGLKYVGHDRGELNMIFHLDHMFLGHGEFGKFDPVPYDWSDVKRIFSDWDEAMGDSGWISIFLDNHDFPRLVSRFGNDEDYRKKSAKLLATMVLTLRGTPCIYQGSELGMTNVHFDSIDDYKDVETHNFHEEFKKKGVSTEEFLKLVHENGRDNVRTPMQWNAEKHAGFTDGEPWIKVNPNYTEINAEAAIAEGRGSILEFYKMMLEFRKRNKTFIYGSFEIIPQESKNLFFYKRSDENDTFIVMLNHSDEEEMVDFDMSDYIFVVSNQEYGKVNILQPWEARILKLRKD
jgi:oligo-1,6-glucosidase